MLSTGNNSLRFVETSIYFEFFFRELVALQELCKTVDKFGIVHEDYLLKLNILPLNVHTKLMNWKKSRRQVPSGFSVLATWLGVYPYGATDSRLGLVAKNLSQRPTVQPKTSAAVRQERMDADDQWEREDVEAIQGERVVVGDDFDDVPRTAKAREQVEIPKYLKLEFAIKNSRLIADQRELQENLSSAPPADQEYIRYKMNELQYQAGIISHLLDALPPLNAAQLKDVFNGNLDVVSMSNRWAAYNAWKGQLLDELGQKERKLEADFRACKNELVEVRTKESADICRPADIVGFTTSGAAKQRALIGHLKPRIGEIPLQMCSMTRSKMSGFDSYRRRSCPGPGSPRGHSFVHFVSAFDSDWWVIT